jgi:hypothetical protein
MVLFGMQNRTSGPYLAAIYGILISLVQKDQQIWLIARFQTRARQHHDFIFPWPYVRPATSVCPRHIQPAR